MVKVKKLDSYVVRVGNMVVNVEISLSEKDFVPLYRMSILNISPITAVVLNKIKEEFVSKVSAGTIDISEVVEQGTIKEAFKKETTSLIKKYFPNIDEKSLNLLREHVMQENIGLGNIEVLLADKRLEEIVVNSAQEPVWVYHREYGWLKTNIRIPTEARIRHYATMIGRDTQKEITVLSPLMDARLPSGDRVNATLSPISSKGNTITIRKFLDRPWTVTDFIKSGTFSYEVAALLWLAVQYELSVLISGGTGSGTTSALNVLCSFFPPNQRIISIEDTREIVLSNNLHWVPLQTRGANPEGKGEVSMLDLAMNSLRMRPDRIVVGEMRRKREAEVLFEAMHTGHSVYGTLHANNAHDTVVRLTNPPIDIPKMMLPVVPIIFVMVRNRRTGVRRVLQIAEVMETGDPRVLFQLDPLRDRVVKVRDSVRLFEILKMYSGLSPKQIEMDLATKIGLLKWMVKNNLTDVNKIGLLIAKYYTGRLK